MNRFTLGRSTEFVYMFIWSLPDLLTHGPSLCHKLLPYVLLCDSRKYCVPMIHPHIFPEHMVCGHIIRTWSEVLVVRMSSEGGKKVVGEDDSPQAHILDATTGPTQEDSID